MTPAIKRIVYEVPYIIRISPFFLSVGNLLSVVEVIHRFTFEAIGNATFSVDSFFFLRYVVDSYLI